MASPPTAAIEPPRLGVSDLIRVASVGLRTRRVRAALLLLEGRVLEAADAWALVSPHDEALARIEAARQLAGAGRTREADLQLERGLAFFRAVGATKIVRDGW